MVDDQSAAAAGGPGGERVHNGEHTDSKKTAPWRRSPNLTAFAAAGVPLLPLAGPVDDLGRLAGSGPLVPAALAGGAVAAVAGTMRRRSSGKGHRRHRSGVSLGPRARAYLRRRPGPGYASRWTLYKDYGRLSARRVAKFGRKSLTWQDRWFGPWEEYASFHGRAQGWIHRWGVYSTFEDLTLMIAPPQEGKSQKAAASLVEAPGPVVATSIRGDLIRDTAGLREQVGNVTIFNPEGVGSYASTMRWNPVAGCQDITVAVRRAGHMVEASENKGLSEASFWADWGCMTLAALMHAAALMGGSMRQVYTWILDKEESDHPLYILDEHAGSDLRSLETLRYFQTSMDQRTRSGVETTLTRTLRFMLHPGVVEMLHPVAGPGFDFESFLLSRDTVYLVSSAGAGNVTAPIFSAFLAEMKATSWELGNKYTNRDGQQVSRLDPPLTIEGDELGNTAPIAVDEWASWCAGSGIRINMYFQTWARIVERWGREGADALWGSAKCKIIGAGVTEERLLAKVAQLNGKIDVRDPDEVSYDQRGNPVRRPRWGEVDATPAGDIRKIPPGKALVLRSTAAAPTLITLVQLRKRRYFKQWVKAGRPAAGLSPVEPREIPRPRPDLAVRPEVVDQVPAAPDELGARRARRTPEAAPLLPLPTRPGPPPLPQHGTPASSGPAPGPASPPPLPELPSAVPDHPMWGAGKRGDAPPAGVPLLPLPTQPAPAESLPTEAAADGSAEGEPSAVPPGWSPWQRRAGGDR
ncbi:type IV secretory system conjugative DNA transfer family protein [Actinomadura mexicana]|uniref:type IV secretory system conjugative DNA transfer family protein n=1 Tax=Actinomadura mexicana TaxID=134959 RepID=UPI000B77DEC8|nr:TraM recognition domain-containing protein [Actinomadura mexicana]